MAAGSTVHAFTITLNDADRGVYAALDFRVAQHPSETAEFLLARVLAYALEYTEGLEFSRGGVSDGDSPALAVRDATGALRAWIDVGAPDAARLQRAARLAPRVAVYCHRDLGALLQRLGRETFHRTASIEVFGLDEALIAALAQRLQRRMSFDLSVSEGHVYLTLADATLDGVVSRQRLGATAPPRQPPLVSHDD